MGKQNSLKDNCLKQTTQCIIEFITIYDHNDSNNTEAVRGEMQVYYCKIFIVYMQ